MRLVSFPIQNLRRRKLRTIVTCAGIATAVGGLIALIGTIRGMEHGWINRLVERGTHVLAVRRGTVELLAASLDESLAGALQRVPGVMSVTGELLDLSELETGEMALLVGWPEASDFWGTLTIRRGKIPARGDSRGVMLGEAAAQALKKDVGSSLALKEQTFVVTGIYGQASVMSNFGVLLPLQTLQVLVDKPGRVTTFNLRIDHPEDPVRAADIMTRLDRAFPALGFTAAADLGESSQVLRVLRATSWSISAIALAMATIIVLNTLMMSVLERTREIGILRAVGWSSWAVFAAVVAEGVLITATGTAGGILAGLGALRWLASLSQIRGLLQVGLAPRLVAEIAAASILVGIVGSVYPAWRAVRLDPVQAIRVDG